MKGAVMAENILLEGLKAARAGEVYLGNVDAVQSIMAGFVSSTADAMAEGDSAKVLALADAMALRFAGGNPGDGLIPGWHVRNQLGIYAATHWSVDPNQDLVSILRTVFILAAGRVADAIKAEHEHGAGAGEFQIDIVVEELTATMTSTWEVMFPE
jgi:hypothetical protein